MLTQELNRYSKPIQSKKHKLKFRAGGKEHRDAIFHGTVEAAFNRGWDQGTNVDTLHKPIQSGVIISIADNMDDCRWDGMKCLCVEVYLYAEGECYMFHPNDLKES